MLDSRCDAHVGAEGATKSAAPSATDASERGRRTYKLYTKELDSNIWHNVMRFYSPRFNVNNLISPIKLVRDIPKPSEDLPRDKKKISNTNFEGGQAKEALDLTKLAPYGNAIKNRQNLFRRMTRTYQMSHSEASEAESRYKNKGVCGYPWKFSDFESPYHYVGTLEGNQDSTYVLFKMDKDSNNEDCLKIIPVKRWYKFTPKPWYRKATEARSDEATASQKAPQIAPTAKKLKEQPGDTSSASEKEKKSWKTKFLDAQLDNLPKKRNRVDEEEEGLDYEEEFEDDEEVNLGIEDAEDCKEALRRQFGKYSRKFGNGRDEYREDDGFYPGRPASKTADNSLASKLRESLDYKDADLVDETFMFSDGDDYSSYKYTESKAEVPQDNNDDKKSKPGDPQQPQAQKNKKAKREYPTQMPKKEAASTSGAAAGTINYNSQPSVPASGVPADAEKHSQTETSEAPSPINPTKKSTSAAEILKMLSKTSPARQLDGIKKSPSLTNEALTANVPRTLEKSGSLPTSTKLPSRGLADVGDSLAGRKQDALDPKPQKKKLVTEEDVINVYAKRGLTAIKAKELASELVVMCENSPKDKEHLKSLLNKMVRSEGGMLHLLPKYRTK